MCLRARSRRVFTSVKNGFDFAFFLATEVTPEGRDSAPVFIHRRAGFSENIRIWLCQTLSRAIVSNSLTLAAQRSIERRHQRPELWRTRLEGRLNAIAAQGPRAYRAYRRNYRAIQIIRQIRRTSSLLGHRIKVMDLNRTGKDDGIHDPLPER